MYSAIEKLQTCKNAAEIINDILKSYTSMLEEMKSVYIWGRKELGTKVWGVCYENNIDIKGFIDNDSKKQGMNFKGVKIYSLKEVLPIEKETSIIIATLNYWTEIERELKESKVKQYIPYPILSIYNKEMFPFANQGLEHSVENLIQNKEKYIDLFDKLNDKISCEVLNELLLFRMTFDTQYLINAYKLSNTYEIEYFDSEIIHLNDQEVFIDGGAYQGETTLEFIRQVHQKYKRIYVFEPDGNLMEGTRAKLKGFENITFYEAGIGERSERVRFNKTGDTGGMISQVGKSVIKIESLDELIDDEVSFIKLDVEGYEKEVLLGARRLINEYTPKLAISAYHKPNDLWEIVDIIGNIHREYKVYIRHYTETYFDTDLYFVM